MRYLASSMLVLCSLALAPVAFADNGTRTKALKALGADRFSEAEQIAMSAKDHLLAKYVRWSTYLSPNAVVSFEEITSFIEASPGWPQQTQLMRRAEEAISVTTPPSRVLKWFKNRTPLTNDGAFALISALEGRGDVVQAQNIARSFWVDGAFSPDQEKKYLALYGRYLTADDHWKRMDRLLWDKQSSPVNRLMGFVSPGRQALAKARMALQDGNGAPEQLIAQVPAQFQDDPGLVYDRVRWRRQKDMDLEAMDLLRHANANQVRPENWWIERNLLARRGLQQGLITRSYETASHHGLPAGTAAYADAEFLSGFIALRFMEDTRAATRHFQNMWDNTKTALSQSKASYWLARSYEAANDLENTKIWYQKGSKFLTAYYGQLSAGKLGQHDWAVPTDPKPTAAEKDRFKTRELVRVAKMLLDTNLGNARPFFVRLGDDLESPAERAMLAKIAIDAKREDLAVITARRADRDHIFLFETGWPMMKVRSSTNVDKALVLGLIRQESGFMRDVKSSVGATGLMQLMPATAKKVAQDIKVAYSPAKLVDPDYNTNLGTKYLSDMIDRYAGSYILALAAYNAGPTRATRWVNEYGDPREPHVDVIDWIEMIPFNETRSYVQRVMESHSIYQRKMGTAKNTPFVGELKRGVPLSQQISR